MSEDGSSGFNPEHGNIAIQPRPEVHKRGILTEPTPPKFSLEDAQRMAAQSGFKPPEKHEHSEPKPPPIEVSQPLDQLQLLMDQGLIRADAATLDPMKRELPETPRMQKAEEEVFGKPTGGIKPATPEQVVEFEESLKTKDFRGQEVLEEITSGGARALRLKNRETGEVTIRRLQQTEGAVGAGGIPDIPENYTEAQLVQYVDGIIETYEGSFAELLKKPDIIEAVVNNIESFPGNAISVAGLAEIPPNPNKLVDLRKELVEKIEARLYLTLLYGQATYGQGEQFASTIGNWGRDGLEYVAFKMEAGEKIRVREVIGKLEETEGSYYRVQTFAQQKAVDDQIVAAETAWLLAQGETPANAAKKAKKALSLGKNLMVVTGQASFWGGAVLAPGGRLRELEIIDNLQAQGVPGFAAGQVDMQREEYWTEWDRIRRQQGIRPVISILPGQRAVGNIGHTNPALFKNAYFAPEVLEEAQVGVAASLRYLAETRVRSLVFYKHQRTLTDFLNTLNPNYAIDVATGELTAANPNNIENIAYPEFGRWARMVKGGGDLLGMFNNKEPFLLNSPFKDPNAAVHDPDKVLGTMEPFIKVGQALNYLSESAPPGYAVDDPYRARVSKLRGLLEFMTTNNHQEREERHAFGYERWNDNLKSAAADDIRRTGLIRRDQYNEVLQGVNYNILAAMFQNGSREAADGGLKFFTGLLKLISRF